METGGGKSHRVQKMYTNFQCTGRRPGRVRNVIRLRARALPQAVSANIGHPDEACMQQADARRAKYDAPPHLEMPDIAGE